MSEIMDESLKRLGERHRDELNEIYEEVEREFDKYGGILK